MMMYTKEKLRLETVERIINDRFGSGHLFLWKFAFFSPGGLRFIVVLMHNLEAIRLFLRWEIFREMY